MVTGLDLPTFWAAELGDRVVSRSGQNWLCRSPFREDVHPSFSVDVVRGLFYDFGDPSKKGDIVDFLREKKGYGYAEARSYLRGRYGADTISVQRRVKSLRAERSGGGVDCGLTAADFCYIEAGRDLKRRREWRVRQVARDEYLAQIDCLGVPGIREAYASMYVHTQAMDRYKQDHGGSAAGYRGPVLAPFVPLDFDDAGDPDRARCDVIKCVETACGRYGANIDNLRVYWSGAKGFHLLLLNQGLADATCTEDTPLRVRRIAEKIGEGCETLDRKLYDSCIRLLRVPNSQNAKTGRYKIPVLLSELYNRDASWFAARARTQRSLRDAVGEVSGEREVHGDSDRKA